jgi:Na+/H+ antiporter NhaD/arsenite permease-like protein
MSAQLLTHLLVIEGAGTTEVAGWQTAVFAGLLILTLAVLATEKIHKTVLVLLSALLCLFLADAWHLLPHEKGSHMPVYIRMIEWEVIGIVIGATVFVEVAARSGLFSYISIRILKLSRGDPFRLLLLFSILTCVFSAFLDNITAMIIIGSLTLVACRKLNLDPLPLLITEGIMTNVGGLLTLISSIPNIIVGKTASISYVSFLLVTTPYVVVAIAVSMVVARKLFGDKVAPLKDPATAARNRALVEAFDEWETVKDRRFFQTSIGAVLAVILLFALKDQIPILRDFGVEVVAMGAATLMLLLHAKDVEHDLSNVEWSLVFFFVGLFTIIGVMERGDVLAATGQLLDGVTEVTGGYGLMWLTAIFSSVTDNIPLAAMMAKILGPTPEAAAQLTAEDPTVWWAVVFGANLGGNISPIGSASTVVACTIMKKNKLALTFLGFVKFGAVFAFLQLLLASVYLFVLDLVL